MPIDLTSLTQVVSDLAGDLESAFSESDAATGDVMVLVEVVHADGKRGLRVVSDRAMQRHRHRRLGLLQEAEVLETGRMAAAMSKTVNENIGMLKRTHEDKQAEEDARPPERS